jgi:mRNA interferase RelE/StbE
VAGKYNVQLARSARKELESLDKSIVVRIFARLVALSDDPRPPGCKKLRGANDLWRVRVGDYRVIYAISDRERVVDVSAIHHRSDAY